MKKKLNIRLVTSKHIYVIILNEGGFFVSVNTESITYGDKTKLDLSI